jgi:hypothetical protein
MFARPRLVTLVATFTFALTAGLAPAQTVALPLRVDMVHSSSPVAVPGYVAMGPGLVYAPASGQLYGWVSTANVTGFDLPSFAADDPVVPDLGYAYEPDFRLLLRQGHVLQNAAGTEFRAKTGAGTFLVRLSLGKALMSLGPGSLDTAGMQVFEAIGGQLLTVETQPVTGASGVWARTMSGKASYNNILHGGYRTIWLRMRVLQGQTEVALRFVNPSSNVVQVDSLEIYAADPEPIRFDKPTQTIKRNLQYASPVASTLQQGVDQLNAQLVDTAQATFSSIPWGTDDLAKSAGLLWTAGWLGDDEILVDGSREWTILHEVIPHLEQLAQTSSTHMGPIALYLDTARAFRRALKLQRWRGYTVPIPFTPEPAAASPFSTTPNNALLLNVNAAEALWHDLSGQALGNIVDSDARVIHPLLFKSFACLGVNWLSRSAHNMHSGPGSPVYLFLKQHYDLWREFDTKNYLTTTFTTSDILRIGKHIATYDATSPVGPDYDQEVKGGIPVNWNYEGSSVVHGTGATRWWDSLFQQTHSVDPAASGPWAGWQWRGREAALAAVKWWNVERLVEGEAGGGVGDDVELFGPLLFTTMPLRNNELDLEPFLRQASEEALAAYEAQHFFGDGTPGSTDVEHTAEYTGYPAFLGMDRFYGEPYFAAYALQTMKHMASAVPQASDWTVAVPPLVGGTTHTYPNALGVPQPIDMRRFVSFYFDAEGPYIGPKPTPPGEPVFHTSGDVPLNGKAVLPSYRLSRRYPNAEADGLMREWAEWWWHVAMKTQGQGMGLQTKPLGVLPAVARIQSGAISFGDLNFPNWFEGIYAFEDAVGTHSYVYSGLFLERFLDPKTPAAERVDYLRPIYHSSQLVAELWRQQKYPADPPILSLPFDEADGEPYWTATKLSASRDYLLDVLRALPHMASDPTLSLDPTHAKHMQYLEEQLQEQVPFALLHLGDDSLAKTGVTEEATHLFDWNDAFFPYGTSFVTYTDRAFLAPGTTGHSLFEAMTGGTIGPHPDVVMTLERDPLDVLAQGSALPKLELSCLVRRYETTPVVKLTTLVRQFEAGPASEQREVTARFWYRLPPGSYELRRSPNTGGLDVLDTANVLETVAFDIVLPGAACVFHLPYATSHASGDEYVLEVRRLGDLPPGKDPNSFADLAVGPTEMAVVPDPGGTTFHVEGVVYNLGSLSAAAEVRCSIYYEGAAFPLGKIADVSLPGTIGLDPSSTLVQTLSLPYPTFPPGAPTKASFLLWLVPTTSVFDGYDINQYALKEFDFAP